LRTQQPWRATESATGHLPDDIPAGLLLGHCLVINVHRDFDGAVTQQSVKGDLSPKMFVVFIRERKMGAGHVIWAVDG
jgi:hypothetical protein